MEIRDLNVLHWRGPRITAASAPESTLGSDIFLIDTCQRRVAVIAGQASVPAARQEFPADGALESYSGADAYAFLLRFACGIESKLSAETEIFGQIKQAWSDFSGRGSSLGRALSPLIQLLFQDAKAIRAQHLGSLGSMSYGSQVRRLLGDQAPPGPTLLVGAGQLAQAVGPWLTSCELWLWNRSPQRARELALELGKRSSGVPVRVIEGDSDAELAAWRAAHHVILCVPADEAQDRARVAAWNERSGRAGRVIHLGLRAESVEPWNGMAGLVSLGAMFDMLQSQTELRRRQLERARRGCLEKALLRSLGGHSSHTHSWEDLAAFISL